MYVMSNNRLLMDYCIIYQFSYNVHKNEVNNFNNSI